MGRSVFGKPFAAHSKLKTMVRAIGEASLVETEDELDGIKQTVPAKRIRSLALAPLFFLFSFLPFSLFLSSRSSSSFVNFLPVLFSPRRVTFYATSRSGIVFSWLLILVFLPFYSRRSCVPSVLQKARAASTFSPVATFCLGRWYFEVSSSLSELRLSILNIRLAWEKLSFHAFFGTLLSLFGTLVAIIVLSLEFFQLFARPFLFFLFLFYVI